MSHESGAMDDRTLLEMAARAAGIDFNTGVGGGLWISAGSGLMREWNPLADDGDCARMEAACEINTIWRTALGYITAGTGGAEDWYMENLADHNNDRNAARRRASTRAAAALGEGK